MGGRQGGRGSEGGRQGAGGGGMSQADHAGRAQGNCGRLGACLTHTGSFPHKTKHSALLYCQAVMVTFTPGVSRNHLETFQQVEAHSEA